MKIWKQTFTLEGLQIVSSNTMVDALGINFTDFGDDYLCATMPVNQNTVQPMRILHGGASVALAETLGSVASVLCLEDPVKYNAVGLEINANHIKSAMEGSLVTGKATPIRIGGKTHVWNIELRDEAEQLICISRLTMMIIENRKINH